jgi:hypothetical protein
METSTLIASGAGAVAAMLIGGLWYSPIMFGNAWRRLSNISENAEPNPAIAYGLSFVLMLLAALVFGAFIGTSPDLGFALGAGFSAGLLWAAGTLWISYLFEGRPLKLALINGGYHIIQYTAYGLLFAVLG